MTDVRPDPRDPRPLIGEPLALADGGWGGAFRRGRRTGVCGNRAKAARPYAKARG